MNKTFKETRETITLHGLGFLQVKLPSKQRIHVWHPDLPRRSCFEYSAIHDHRFGFVSKVLIGEQINQLYRILPGEQQTSPTHGAYLHEGERTKFGNRPWIKDFECRIDPVGDPLHITPGNMYEMNPYMLHATRCEGVTVTLMTKTIEGGVGAHSFCELGVDPDVDFSRKQISQDDLWRIFVDAMAMA